MKRYDAYKPSGIEWIGEVPEHWEMFRIKYVLSRSAAGVWGDDEKGDENDIICYRIADFDYNHGGLMLDDLTTRNIEPKQLEGRIVKEGDLLIEKSGGGDATPVGRVVKVNSDQRATYTNFIHSVSVKDGYCGNYLYYYFFNLYAQKINLLFFNQTTGLQNLKVGDYLGQTIYLPPIDEQEAIAAYLDACCTDIDKVVATQQKRIALLQELKQSEITQAVTRGLNPDAKMKDSGVEWIGMVPEHWEKCRFKDFLSLVTIPSVSEMKIGLENIESGTGRFIETDSEFEGNGVEFNENDIVYGKLRPYLQKVWLATFKGNAVGDFFVFREKENSYSLYLKYLLLSDGFTKEADGATVGAKMPRVSSDFILTMRYYLPNREEQIEIADYLDCRCGEIDRQIDAVTRQIELLTEYKQSLITEVVTGKKKVC